MLDGKDQDLKQKMELIDQLEKLYQLLSNNITIEGRDVVHHCLVSARESYPQSESKDQWRVLLNNLADVINSFEKDLPEQGELKLYALKKNLEELENKEKAR